jgi:hypothetical protein
VVRLDLKPSNIVLLDGIRPVVTELGLARCLEESGPDRPTGVMPRHWRANVLFRRPPEGV